MADTPFIRGMRDAYLDALYPFFLKDDRCVIITADNGAPSLDKFQQLPGQFFTVGIAEQQMLGMAAGLASEGRRVWVYAIAPFVTTRVHEFVKLDVCAHGYPVTILGVGAGLAYDIMGPSHHALEDVAIMRTLPGLTIWSPSDSACAAALAPITYGSKSPCYVRFDRAGLADLYQADGLDLTSGLHLWPDCKPPSGDSTERADLLIVTSGVMTHQALRAQIQLRKHRLVVSVADVHRLKPFPADELASHVASGSARALVTLEEHYLAGGLGSIVAEIMADGRFRIPLLRLGVPERFLFRYGGRDALWRECGLDVQAVVDKLCQWIQSWIQSLR